MRVEKVTNQEYKITLLKEDRGYFEDLAKELGIPTVKELLGEVLDVGITYLDNHRS